MLNPGVIQVPIVDCDFFVVGLVVPRTFDISAPDVLSVPLGVIHYVARVFFEKDGF